MRPSRSVQTRHWILSSAVALLVCGHATAALAQPAFSQSFTPTTVAPDGAAALVYVIDNAGAGTPVTGLAFTNTLPAGVTIASPTGAETTCVDAVVSAPLGGDTITLSGARLGAGVRCTITLYVAGVSAGTHLNTTGDLTSSAGNSGTASATLIVDGTLPRLVKTWAPASVPWQGTTRVTYLVDASATAGNVLNVQFTDVLDGALVADPPNLAGDCAAGAVTASPGASTISLLQSLLTAGASCSFSVDVRATSAGVLTSYPILQALLQSTFTSVQSGYAIAPLTVSRDDLHLAVDFVDDPLAPGDSGTLRFTIWSFDRSRTVTDVGFSVDLGAALSGLGATGLPIADVCGAGSQVAGTSTVTLTGASLGPESSCSFDVAVAIPAGASTGTYTATTSAITGTVAGEAATGNVASAKLLIAAVPYVTQTLPTGYVPSGSNLDIELTITNPSATAAATDIRFVDLLGELLPGTAIVTPPAAGFCGAGSTATPTLVLDVLQLILAGASLDPGASCSFTITVSVPPGTGHGVYTNRTTALTATMDGESLTGAATSESITVVAPPSFSMAFAPGPHRPGDSVALTFALELEEEALATAQSIAFTADLDAALTGLVATGLPLADVCGTGSQLTGTSSLALTGGSLEPGTSCSFAVMVSVPAGAAGGSYPTTTSAITADYGGTTATGNGAAADLVVANVLFSKRFDDPVRPGATADLSFEIQNISGQAVTGLVFTDNLGAVLPGLVSTSGTIATVCGAGSQITGTNTLVFTGGTLGVDETCTIVVSVAVPDGAAADSYVNVTSNLSATVGGVGQVLPPATDTLEVADPLLISKTFTTSAAPGGTVELEITLSNADDTTAATELAFTDDLGAALAGLVATGLPLADGCGVGSQLSGTDVLTFTGGTLAAGTSCTLAVTLQLPDDVPMGTTVVNVTSALTGTLDGASFEAAPATAELIVEPIVLTAGFAGEVTAGSTVALTFTLENLNTTSAADQLDFTHDLDAALSGLVATALPAVGFCGDSATIAGTDTLAIRGAQLAAGASCSFDVELTVPADAVPGAYDTVTSAVTRQGVRAAAPASAQLTVVPHLPTLTKAFAAELIALGEPTLMTLTIDNSANVVALDAIALTDTFPAGMVIADGDAATTCGGGTLTAADGTATVTLADATVEAGATCTVTVNVTADTVGDYTNVAQLSSSAGDSADASADLSAYDPDGLPDAGPNGGGPDAGGGGGGGADDDDGGCCSTVGGAGNQGFPLGNVLFGVGLALLVLRRRSRR